MKDAQNDTAWTVAGSDLRDGTWTVRLHGSADAPKLEASHLHRTVPDMTVTQGDDHGLAVAISLPRAVMSDGLQSIHLIDKNTGTTLASLHVAAGKQVSVDMAAELALLRDEMDLLKRSLRALMVD